MKKQIAAWLQHHSKLSLTLALLYLAGFLWSAVQLGFLPAKLSVVGLPGQQVVGLAAPLLLATGLTLLIGILALYLIVSSKKQIVVYLDRTESTDQQKTDTQNQRTDAGAVIKDIQQQKGNPAHHALSALCQWLQAGQGAYYEVDASANHVKLAHAFAFAPDDERATSFQLGEGLIGQAAASGQSLYLDEIPDGYVRIVSGLGSSSPRYVYIFCVKREKVVRGVYEVATFAPVTQHQKQDLEQIATAVGNLM
jgi:methyl-accepting chemotaxis protein